MSAPRSRRNKGAKRRPATPDEVTEQDKAGMASRLHNRGALLESAARMGLAHPIAPARSG